MVCVSLVISCSQKTHAEARASYWPSNMEAVLRPKSGRWEGEYFPFDGRSIYRAL